MPRFNLAPLGVALATALAGTTGYCVLTNAPDRQPPQPPANHSPTRLLPPAIDPYQIETVEPVAPDG